ncbi:MAG: hypothetical protein LBT40_02470 [Deltaproteobacteria bacterium]|nr:hypothetical protein [Deltaproteobacteria bacterium]
MAARLSGSGEIVVVWEGARDVPRGLDGPVARSSADAGTGRPAGSAWPSMPLWF